MRLESTAQFSRDRKNAVLCGMGVPPVISLDPRAGRPCHQEPKSSWERAQRSHQSLIRLPPKRDRHITIELLYAVIHNRSAI